MGNIVSFQGTFSFSFEFIADISRLSAKSSDSIASKHFFKCGCTARGFFVCDKICSSSSFDRKKNRLNARRFVSRYSARLFCTLSSILLLSANWSRSFWFAHIVSTLGVFFVCPSVLRQKRSTFMKRFDSSGSCSWMSGASKMGERYIQLRCTASHSSRISETRFSCFSQALMRSSNGFLNGEKDMDCVITM